MSREETDGRSQKTEPKQSGVREYGFTKCHLHVCDKCRADRVISEPDSDGCKSRH